jgi:hypothetical protein
VSASDLPPVLPADPIHVGSGVAQPQSRDCAR